MSEISKRIEGGLWGAVVGEALGISARNKTPDFDGQPPGTWSWGTSLSLMTCKWIPRGMPVSRFLWEGKMFLMGGHWTAWRGEVFEIDQTTLKVLNLFDQFPDRASWGDTDKKSVGSGSLLRNLPVAIWHRHDHPKNIIFAAKRSSAITHALPVCQSICSLHALIAVNLSHGFSVSDALEQANKDFPVLGAEHEKMSRLLDLSIFEVEREEICPDGSAVSTLETALWCLHRHKDFSGAVLEAVNLGKNANLTGSIVGGLAGIRGGFKAIPKKWIEALVNNVLLRKCFEDFQEDYGNYSPG